MGNPRRRSNIDVEIAQYGLTPLSGRSLPLDIIVQPKKAAPTENAKSKKPVEKVEQPWETVTREPAQSLASQLEQSDKEGRYAQTQREISFESAKSRKIARGFIGYKREEIKANSQQARLVNIESLPRFIPIATLSFISNAIERIGSALKDMANALVNLFKPTVTVRKKPAEPKVRAKPAEPTIRSKPPEAQARRKPPEPKVRTKPAPIEEIAAPASPVKRKPKDSSTTKRAVRVLRKPPEETAKVVRVRRKPVETPTESLSSSLNAPADDSVIQSRRVIRGVRSKPAEAPITAETVQAAVNNAIWAQPDSVPSETNMKHIQEQSLPSPVKAR